MTGNPHATVTYPWPVGQKWEHVEIVNGKWAEVDNAEASA